MGSSVSPSEVTPLIQNYNARATNGNTSYTSGDGNKIPLASGGNGKISFLQISFQRSASTLSEAVTRMKRIGYLGSMAIAVNSLTGPAM
jgi:hypothetical protein